LKTVIALLLLSCVIQFPALGQKAATKPGASADSAPASRSADASRLPTKEEVDAAMTRSFGYEPAISWTVIEIRASPIPGVADVVISINKQPAQHMYLSEDTQNAIIGEMIPFGPNPFLQDRAKLATADGPARGSQTPAILIVEFSDLECPHCKASQPIIEKLVADFPQVRFVFQQFPLPASMHPWAMKAAEYSDCAGQLDSTSFWKYTNAVFENQGGITLENADSKLAEIATGAGLDTQKMGACAALPATEARVKKSLDFGTSLDVHETPTIFINGRRVLSIANIPYESLKKLVQFEIDHAGK
jgi:protein-disulfide isomerase